MKRVIAFILAVLLIIPSAILPAAADRPDFTVNVMCCSNVSDRLYITVLVHSDRLYISARDAAELSRSTYTVTDDRCFFSKSDYELDCIVGGGYEYDGELWLPLEKTMETLETSVTYGVPVDDETALNILVFRTKLCSAEQVLKEARRVMVTERGRYEIKDMDNMAGFWGKYCSFAVNLLSGDGLSYVTGGYDRELYEKIFVDLMTINKDSGADIAEILIDGDTLLDRLSSGLEAYQSSLLEETVSRLELATMDTLERMDACYFLDDGLNDWGKVAAMYSKLTDPLGLLFESKLGIEVKGFDFSSALSIAQMLRDADKTNDTMIRMLNTTILSDIGHETSTKKWSDMDKALDGVIDIFTSESALDQTVATVKYTFENALDETLTGLAGDPANYYMQKGISYIVSSILPVTKLKLANGGVIELSKFMMNLALDGVFDKMEFVEKSILLSSIQKRALEIYNIAKNDPDCAVNVKYSALLYLRCAQVNNLYRMENDPSARNIYKSADEQYTEAMIPFLEADDWDLNVDITNKKIDADRLLEDYPDHDIVVTPPEEEEYVPTLSSDLDMYLYESDMQPILVFDSDGGFCQGIPMSSTGIIARYMPYGYNLECAPCVLVFLDSGGNFRVGVYRYASEAYEPYTFVYEPEYDYCPGLGSLEAVTVQARDNLLVIQARAGDTDTSVTVIEIDYGENDEVSARTLMCGHDYRHTTQDGGTEADYAHIFDEVSGKVYLDDYMYYNENGLANWFIAGKAMQNDMLALIGGFGGFEPVAYAYLDGEKMTERYLHYKLDM